MITDDRPEIDVLYAVENVGLDEGAGLAEMSDELFHLVTLGAAAASAGRTVLGETAGALDEKDRSRLLSYARRIFKQNEKETTL